ncbi:MULTISPECIES: hypothetical protein [unclassified Idiomarina]|uniref:hypothetical protein n=1 Tax=unclassified Idiomarina TaxID=2614829 RepID=UPI0002F657E2|nr:MULTISPECIES: hypothetical protein [unclassified Idiomarina]|tara:strand:- start:202 stop:1035 length:834 start_codon:yes stop_codon:yes gene_type:complete
MGKGKRLKVRCRRLKRWVVENDAKVVLYSAVIVMALTIIVYSAVFWDFNWGGPEGWADFGGYFSGIVTPIVALGSAFLFYRSLKIQRIEFRRASKAMKDTVKLHHEAVLAQQRANELLNASEELKQKAHIQGQLEKSIERYAREKGAWDTSFADFFPKTRIERLSLSSSFRKFGAEKLKKALPNSVSEQELGRYIFNYIKVSIDLLQVMSKYLRNGRDVHTYRHYVMGIMIEKGSVNRFLKELGFEGEAYLNSYNKEVDAFGELDNRLYRNWFDYSE